MAKEPIQLSLNEMVKSVAEGLTQVARKPNIVNYQPHPKQQRFHQSNKKGRLYIGGNRAGKTVAGCTEAIRYAKGEHPNKEVPSVPNTGRIVTVDFKKGEQEIIIPQLKQWIPPSLLKNGSWDDSYSIRYHKLTLANGSTMEIMSHEQELDAYAGVQRDWTWFDEECPKSIWKECLARLVDTNGDWWLTMTPVEGMTWVYEDLFEPNLHAEDTSIDIIIVDMAENPHIPIESRTNYLAGLNDEERRIRGHGEFVPLGGLLLKEFKYKNNVIEHVDAPEEWDWWVSIDHGFRNPTGILWHAVSPNGGVYTFHEHYKSEWTIEMHAKKIKEINAKFPKEPGRYVGDLAMNQRNSETGLSVQQIYRQNGIPVALAKKGKGSVDAGINKMNEYFRQGRWQISDRCNNLLKEIRTYRGKPYASSKIAEANNKREEPQKKNDHAIDSARYLFTFMPDLAKGAVVDSENRIINTAAADLMQEYGVNNKIVNLNRLKVYPWQIDQNLLRPSNPHKYELEYGEVY